MCGPPPEVEHGRPMGSSQQRYPVNSMVRYQCEEGYVQRRLPVIHCLSDGQWEEPRVECTEGTVSQDHRAMRSPVDHWRSSEVITDH